MFVTYILSQIRAYLRYRETVRELSQLGDRELSDLGIVRYDIHAVARTSAAAAYPISGSQKMLSPPSGGLWRF